MINVRVAHIDFCSRIFGAAFFLSLIVCVCPICAGEHAYLPASEKDYLTSAQVKIDAVTHSTRSDEFLINIIDDYQDGSYKITSLIDQEDGGDPFSMEAILTDNNGVVYHGTKKKGGTRCIATGYELHRSCSTAAKFEQNDGSYYRLFILNELDRDGKFVREMARGEMPELQFSLDKTNSVLAIKNTTSTPLKIVKIVDGKNVKAVKNASSDISSIDDYKIPLEAGMCANDRDDAYSFVDSIRIYCKSTKFEGQTIIYEAHFQCSCNPYKAGVGLALADLNICYEQVERMGTELELFKNSNPGSRPKRPTVSIGDVHLSREFGYAQNMLVGEIRNIEYRLTNGGNEPLSFHVDWFEPSLGIYRNRGMKNSCSDYLDSKKSCVINLFIFPNKAGEINQKLTVRNDGELSFGLYDGIRIKVRDNNFPPPVLQIIPQPYVTNIDSLEDKRPALPSSNMVTQNSDEKKDNIPPASGSIYNIICPTGELINVSYGYTGGNVGQICEQRYKVYKSYSDDKRLENRLQYSIQNNSDSKITLQSIKIASDNPYLEDDQDNFIVEEMSTKVIEPGEKAFLTVILKNTNIKDLDRTLNIGFKKCSVWCYTTKEELTSLPILISRPMQ